MMETEDVDGACACEAKGSPAEPKPEPASLTKRLKLDPCLDTSVGPNNNNTVSTRQRSRKTEDRIDEIDEDAEIGDLNLEEQDFQFQPSVPSNFAKFNKNPSISDMMDTIKLPHYQRSDQLGRAEVCPRLHRPQLVTNKSRLKALFGYEVGTTTYFWPEEALYLLETGKLEVYCDQVVVSAERARCLLLRSKDGSSKDPLERCEVDEYRVFKYFSQLGYRLRRTEAVPTLDFLEVEEDQYGEDDGMDTGGMQNMTTEEGGIRTLLNLDHPSAPIPNHIPPSAARSNRKRRASQPLERVPEEEELELESDTSSVISMPDELMEDSDCEFLEIVENEALPGGVVIHEHETMAKEEDQMEEEPQPGPSSRLYKTAYTVTEADSDSDLEILDEHIHSHGVSGVGIEELATDAHPITGSADVGTSDPGIVDLVSSDSEDEEHPSSSAYEPIWAQLIPNGDLRMSFPPAHLLPEGIPSREERPSQFDCRNRGDGDGSDIDLDGLRLDSSGSPPRTRSPSSQGPCSSWKEWRQLLMAEARDVLHDSLLGSSESGRDLNQKLHLWKEVDRRRSSSTSSATLHIPFFLFPQNIATLSKRRLGTEIQPIYRVAIVRNDCLLPDLNEIESRDEDIPILFVILSEDSDLLFLTSNSASLPSLC